MTSKVTKNTKKNDDVGSDEKNDVGSNEQQRRNQQKTITTRKRRKNVDVQSDERNDDVESDETYDFEASKKTAMLKATKKVAFDVVIFVVAFEVIVFSSNSTFDVVVFVAFGSQRFSYIAFHVVLISSIWTEVVIAVVPCVHRAARPCPGDLPRASDFCPRFSGFCPDISQTCPDFLPRSVRSAPRRSRRDLPRFADWANRTIMNQAGRIRAPWGESGPHGRIRALWYKRWAPRNGSGPAVGQLTAPQDESGSRRTNIRVRGTRYS